MKFIIGSFARTQVTGQRMQPFKQARFVQKNPLSEVQLRYTANG
jgi:hypothetical protein